MMKNNSFTHGTIQDYVYEEEFEQPLDATFFRQLTATQKLYNQKRDETSMCTLLAYYTDCVNYFQSIEQSVSQYFQDKIRQLVKNVKIFGRPEDTLKNKQKLANDVVKLMSTESVHKTINTEFKKFQNVKELERQSLKTQEERLQLRIQRSKRSMSKSQSLTFSLCSINSSPQKYRKKEQSKQIRDLKAKNIFLFKKDISSSDGEEQSTT